MFKYCYYIVWYWGKKRLSLATSPLVFTHLSPAGLELWVFVRRIKANGALPSIGYIVSVNGLSHLHNKKSSNYKIHKSGKSSSQYVILKTWNPIQINLK